MKFKARVYRVNKNDKYQSYFATIKQDEFNQLELRDTSAILLSINKNIFPTVIRRLYAAKERFMYGFSIPQKIGKDLPVKSDIDFEFLSTNLNQKIEENEESIYLPNILPEKTIRNSNFYKFDLGDKILIWIYSTGNKWYTLPKNISFSKNGYDLLEFFGGYFCEGFKARKINKHLDRLSYSSSEVDQIEWFISSMKNLFNVEKSEWSTQILLRNYNKGDNEYIIKHWISSGLEKDKIRIINNSLVNDKLGVCIVNIYNSTLAEAMYEIFQHCKKTALENRSNSLEFFRGLSRGDLGVSINNKKNILTFSAESEEDIKFFLKICDNLDIKTGKIIYNKRKNYWLVFIHDFNTFRNIVKLGAIAHQRRKNYFYKKFLDSKGCTEYKYLKAIAKDSVTVKNISKTVGKSLVTARTNIYKFKRRNLIVAYKYEGINCLSYSLSKEGIKLLNFYISIEKEINNNL